MRRRDPNKESNGSMSEKEYKAIRKRVKELQAEEKDGKRRTRARS